MTQLRNDFRDEAGQDDEFRQAAKTVLVIGASRGLGRGIASAFAAAGFPTVAVSRSRDRLDALAGQQPRITAEVGDAADSTLPETLVSRYHPHMVVLVAGAMPPTAPVHELTWEEFSVNWHTDVYAAFLWVRDALTRPWPPGSHLVIVSSRAALGGSPISGGYAGAKATQRFLAKYGQDESDRAGLRLTFTTVLPMLTPATDLGQDAIRVYAERNQQTEAELVRQMGPVLTPEIAGAALVDLLTQTSDQEAPAATWELTGTGLHPLPTP